MFRVVDIEVTPDVDWIIKVELLQPVEYITIPFILETEE